MPLIPVSQEAGPALAAPRTKQVFINCPFDAKYKPIFNAIVFALHDLGFIATCALDKSNGEPFRLKRIYELLRGCAYSIHDLSRISLTGPLRLPRFNMPFEAGIAYAMHQSLPSDGGHRFLVLDSKPHRYQASISDLAGFDPAIHGDDPLRAIAAIRTFFAQHNTSETYNGADFIQRRYALFISQLPAKAREKNISAKILRSWDYALDLQKIIAGWVDTNP